jgi:hypothetical protein
MDKDTDDPGKEPPDRDLVFYYSRARRLERASAAVRALNEEGASKRPLISRTFSASKSLSLLFLVLMGLILVIVSIVSSRDDGSRVLGGNTVTVSARKFQGTTYLTIKKSVKQQDEVYTGTVDLAVSPALSPEEEKNGAVAPISTHRIFFSLDPEEEYRLSVPFESSRLLLLMQAGEELIRLSVEPE